MQIVIVVRVEVERDEGKFASREEIEQALLEEIEQADPGSIDSLDSGGVYSTTAFDCEAVDPREFDRVQAAGARVVADRRAAHALRRSGG